MVKRFKRTHKVHTGHRVNLGHQKAHASSDSPNQPSHNQPSSNQPLRFNPQNFTTQGMGGPTIVRNTSTSPTPTTTKQPTVYATNMKTGEKQVYHGLTTLQERQNLAAAGFRLTTKPPPATGYVGDVSTPDYLKAAYGMGSNQYDDPNLQAAASVDPTPKQVYNPETGYMESPKRDKHFLW